MSLSPIRLAVLGVVSCLLAAGLALPQTTKPATAAKKTTAPKKTTVASARKGKTTKGRASTTTPVARYRQTAPTPDRYKEIQQALVDKGYLKSEPSGVWDNDSADAMKQFQTEKNLPPTGKITAASLIGLGLGPKNESNIAAAGAPAASPESAAPAPAPPATVPPATEPAPASAN